MIASKRALRGLYVILDLAVLGDFRDPERVARAALRGGARVLQLRAKGADKGLLLPLARALRHLVDEHQGLLVINDHLDLALAAGAHGVHVGPADLPVQAVRAVGGPGILIGYSAKDNVGRARQARDAGADYVSVGALFPTASKADTVPAGLATIGAMRRETGLPVCAIGGIDVSHVDAVAAAGADLVAVIGAVCLADDPHASTRALVARLAASPASA